LEKSTKLCDHIRPNAVVTNSLVYFFCRQRGPWRPNAQWRWVRWGTRQTRKIPKL